ncbi:uncharacterized protein LOC111634902 [Centruroides sculpturatus]|uniref:uncharacterized protein LOC111634902 n=1 Tax=Centruroides sculpturatus TaxID=218467 RepID=UPI000C6DE493|nr:uncharacterized protein LOC111634902 [Centruroides sculpturatus]
MNGDEGVAPSQEHPAPDMTELFAIREELERYMEENPNSKFGTKTHSKSILEFFDRMIDVFKSTKKPVNMELDNITTKLDLLIEATKQQKPATVSYADKARGTPPEPKPNIGSAVILIESTDKKEDAEEIKKRIKQQLNPKVLKVGITKVRKIRNQSVLIEVERKGSEKQLIEEINKITNLTAREPKKILPKIAIYNVPKDLTKEEITEAIFQQNTRIADQYTSMEEFKKDILIKYKWGRKPDVNHWVCEVAPKLKKSLTKQKKINIDWVRCNTEEYFNIIQCFRCCKYGHFAKECSSDRAYCNHCGGDHKYAECRNKSTAPSCINCVRNNANNFAHRANQSCCGERMKIIRNIQTRTNYG